MRVRGPGQKAPTCSFSQCLGETPCPAGSVEPAQAASAYKESFWDVTAFAGECGAACEPGKGVFTLDLNRIEVRCAGTRGILRAQGNPPNAHPKKHV